MSTNKSLNAGIIDLLKTLDCIYGEAGKDNPHIQKLRTYSVPKDENVLCIEKDSLKHLSNLYSMPIGTEDSIFKKVNRIDCERFSSMYQFVVGAVIHNDTYVLLQKCGQHKDAYRPGTLSLTGGHVEYLDNQPIELSRLLADTMIREINEEITVVDREITDIFEYEVLEIYDMLPVYGPFIHDIPPTSEKHIGYIYDVYISDLSKLISNEPDDHQLVSIPIAAIHEYYQDLDSWVLTAMKHMQCFKYAYDNFLSYAVPLQKIKE